MEKSNKKKLELKRQNIRKLSPEELEQAQGGIVWTTTVTVTSVVIF